ncbi:DUF1353 domain-containing protein [Chitinimonas sp. BJB300]|uniref:DUF1353 domain-containing protein n=1 Tax=Chitinimonas sp. BJB300 TaxID=1559339 RepID=UPI0013043CDC|nr:DUF1353 domain-containing protein [Chitinimonas sp. BJB300]
MRGHRLWFFCALLVAHLVAAAQADDYGTYVGKVVVEWLPNGRDMKLTQPFAYISPGDTRWEAPEGSVVDGASIPRIAWTMIGGPFEGKYREASVIHDVACVQKSRIWQQVHRAFYTAMRASGVDATKAKIMYAAVIYFGPHWDRIVNPRQVPLAEINLQIQAISRLASQDERLMNTWVSIRAPHPDFGTSTSQNAAEIIMTFASPKPRKLSEKQFDALKAEIQAKDIPLTEIENYTPSDALPP